MQAVEECPVFRGHPRQVCIAAAAREGTQLLRTLLLLARSPDTLLKAAPTNGSEALPADFIKELLVNSALDVHSVLLEELIAKVSSRLRLSALFLSRSKHITTFCRPIPMRMESSQTACLTSLVMVSLQTRKLCVIWRAITTSS